MSVILVFILVVIGLSLWWLVQQRVTARPWLEVGPDPVGGASDTGLPTPKIALAGLLGVIGALFALFASAYLMRMEYADWRATPVPPIVWLNTGLLVLASILLHCAKISQRRRDGATLRLGLVGGGIASLAFVAGQLAAWRELAASGFGLSGNAADSFFYILTGFHALHVLAGLIALAIVLPPALTRPRPVSSLAAPDGTRAHRGAGRPEDGHAPSRALAVELCATYWHFLLLVWLGLLVLFTGGAAEVIAICRAILT